MQHFKEFLLMLQTFNLKIITAEAEDPAQKFSITHENGYRTNSYANHLNALKELAMIDLLPYDYMQIQLFLGRVENVSSKFREFWISYHRNSDNIFDQPSDYFLQSLSVDTCFIINGLEQFELPNPLITQYFTIELVEAIEFKEHVLNSFVEEIVGILHDPGAGYALEESVSDLQRAEEEIPTLIASKVEIVAEVKEELFSILKNYFSLPEQVELKSLIFNDITPCKKLNFNSNGNQLADAFKQLYEANLITGCSKVHLERWISRNFCYIHNSRVKHFTEGYLNGIISSDFKKCQSPILDVRKRDARFVVTSTLRNKKNYQIG